MRPEIRALAAYKVADAAGMIKLDAMENPYTLPDALRDTVGAAAAAVPVNRYPDGDAEAVKAALRAHFDIPAGLGIVLGNGSDELIHLAALTVATPGAAMLAPDPSFVMYRLTALLCGMRFVGVPLKPGFALDADAMLDAIARERAGARVHRVAEQPDRQSLRGARRRADRARGARPRRRRRGVPRLRAA